MRFLVIALIGSSSRLGCRVQITEAFDGKTIEIPLLE